MNCKNCNQDYEGKYCNNCGQKANAKRLDFGYLRDEVVTSIFQLERGMLFTMKELVTRPGHSIRAFIEGKRKNHFKPLAFLLVAGTLYVISNKIVGNTTVVDQFIEGFKEGGQVLPDSPEEKIFNGIIDYQVYVILIAMLIYSVASYLAFIKSGYNFIEHLVLNFYISGQQFFIYTIFSFFIFEDESIFILIPFLLAFLFNAWTFIQFFKDKGFLKKIGLVLLTYILFFIILFIVMMIISFTGKYLNMG